MSHNEFERILNEDVGDSRIRYHEWSKGIVKGYLRTLYDNGEIKFN